MSKLKVALVAIAMATAATSAYATEGWYGRVDVGYSIDAEASADNYYDYNPEAITSSRSDSSVDLEDDFMFSGGFGYAYANGFRAEAEFARRYNQISNDYYYYGDSYNDVTVSSLMVNMYYDFNRGGSVEPYIGLGAGMANIDVPGDEDDSWAWQGLVGVAFSVGERTDIDLGYRYFRMEDVSLYDYDAEYTHQAITVGVRYQFTPPPAPPQPEPQPQPQPQPEPQPVVCPTSEFTVYFEWDRSNLNDAALQTIDAAVQRARECNTSAVRVIGHTDTSGSTAYNVGLSQRRASVVRDAMVARGMAADLIATEARGEADLARQTRDGVREPLNRRTAVTITFR